MESVIILPFRRSILFSGQPVETRENNLPGLLLVLLLHQSTNVGRCEGESRLCLQILALSSSFGVSYMWSKAHHDILHHEATHERSSTVISLSPRSSIVPPVFCSKTLHRVFTDHVTKQTDHPHHKRQRHWEGVPCFLKSTRNKDCTLVRVSWSTCDKADELQIGGGLGGLAAGIALKSIGHNVTILERNPTPLLQNQGAGIVAGGDTLAFFNKYDRSKRDFACPSQKRMYLNKAGEVIHEVEMKQAMTSWDLAYYLMRANFDGAESDYCKIPEPVKTDGKVAYRYGCTFKDVTEVKRGPIKVHFDKHDGGSEAKTADLLVAADGPSSSVRKLFCPEVERTSTGYCALRGTVPETEVSDAAKEVFQERFSFFHSDGIQILAYLIPGTNGAVEPGKRLVNFVWYYNFLEPEALDELMTDAEGRRHRTTLPPGSIAPEVWEKLKKVAQDSMPPQFAEIITKTKQPFAQAITDVISSINSFMNGKVLLIGDALAGFRPHTVASTSQAAYDAMMLAEYADGKKSHDEFVKETMMFGRLVQKRGVEMGNRSQFGKDVSLVDHVHDRNVASTKREDEVYPEWTKDGLPG